MPDEIYKLRGKDFYPVKGIGDYHERTNVFSEHHMNKTCSIGAGILFVYNAVIVTGVLVGIVKGLEVILR
jgi:hypothetical protein